MVEVSELGISETALSASDTCRTDHIDKTVGMLVDKADSLLAGFWSYHHDDTNVILVGYRFHHLEIVVERQVGNNCSTHSSLNTFFEKSLDAKVHDWVEIAHQHKRKAYFALDGFQLSEESLHGHTVLQSPRSGTLNDRSVGQRVTERYAHLYHIDAMTFHCLDDIARAFESGTTGTEIQAQQLAFFTTFK